MRFITKVYHPSGAICLDILKDAWSPVLTLKSTLISLQSLLCSPEPSDPQDAEVAKHYSTSRASFNDTARYWAQISAGAPGCMHRTRDLIPSSRNLFQLRHNWPVNSSTFPTPSRTESMNSVPARCARRTRCKCVVTAVRSQTVCGETARGRARAGHGLRTSAQAADCRSPGPNVKDKLRGYKAASSVGAEGFSALSVEKAVALLEDEYPDPSLAISGSTSDVRDEAAITEAVRTLGPVEHVVYTAVDARIRGPIGGEDIAQAKDLFGVKFWGQVAVAKAIANYDIVSPGGSYTITSGTLSLKPVAGTAVGGALNAAVNTLAKGLAGPLPEESAGQRSRSRFRHGYVRANRPSARGQNALQLAHAAVSEVSHPLLSEDLLQIKNGVVKHDDDKEVRKKQRF